MYGRMHKKTLIAVFARCIDSLVKAGVTYEAFVEELRQHYEAVTPPKERYIRWSAHDDAVEMLQADVCTVRSWFNPSRTVRPPLEALPSIVFAFRLNPEIQLALTAELSALMGGFFVREIDIACGSDVFQAGRLNKELADPVMAVADMLADGELNLDDAAKALDAILQINEAISVLLAHRQHIEVKALGKC